MEMLVASILKAAGVDPEKAKADLANYGKQLGEKITSLDASLIALRADQAQVFRAVQDLSDQIADRVADQIAQAAEAQRTANGEARHATRRQ
jgi:hypothetical protein